MAKWVACPCCGGYNKIHGNARHEKGMFSFICDHCKTGRSVQILANGKAYPILGTPGVTKSDARHDHSRKPIEIAEKYGKTKQLRG